MDWTALSLSLALAGWTLAILLPLAVVAGRWLASTRSRSRPWLEALTALPLVLPPTVVGFYLLVALGAQSPLGDAFARAFGAPLAFSFAGLVVASVIVNIPFAVQPLQRAFGAIPHEVREAAQCCGLSRWQAFLRIELPLAWPGVLSATVLTFAHTLGEFGVVLMVGGSIPGETKTIAIAIYDRVQAFDTGAAGTMALALLVVSFATVALSFVLSERWLGGARR
ncbi:Molybdenum transport system permease protein ModB [Burkholderiales bacterium]|nr:Molybdenum transport system permease protein ModB [Burkholderiales bacterium]